MASSLDIQIVSHGTPELVRTLLADLSGLPAHIHLLENLADAPEASAERPALRHADRQPRGFAANHNLLASRGDAEFIAILNPDLHLDAAVFEGLLSAFDDPAVGIVAPRVQAPDGAIADNARRVLTPARLLRDRLHPVRRRSDYPDADHPCEPDWVAGMCLLVRRRAFDELGGFDAGYRMYCEDMDLCVRAWQRGWKVRCLPARGIVHDARRASLRDPGHFVWHVASLLRFWRSPAYRSFVTGPPAGRSHAAGRS
ncbi:MAG: glycosyltransferase [Rhodocyclaceae bacterium]|nr:glycosyltransferase [Rhodocyclaceae bacterium]